MNKNTVRKNKFQNGAALLLFIVLFLGVSMSLVLTIGKRVYDDYVAYQNLYNTKQSFLSAEGGIEDAIYRLREVLNYSESYSFTYDGITIDMTHSVSGGSHIFVAESLVNDSVQKSEVYLTVGDGASFGYGLHSGTGGIIMENSSSVKGNIFSNSSVTGAGNDVFGDVIAAGAGGLVDDIHATGTVRSHTINDSIIDEDAYYQTLTSTFVNGAPCTSNPNCHPGSPDQPTQPFAIDDATIDEWKTNIETTGTTIASTSPECSGGTYTINFTTTLDNVKIECNVVMKKQGASTIITLEGPLWVVGDLSFDAGPTIIASSSLGTGEVQIIVDTEDTTAPYDTGLVTLGSGTTFTSATTSSYILLVVMNQSSENGGSYKAIDLGQNSTGRFIAYAPHGMIEIGQSVSLKAVTAHKIRLFNTGEIVYEDGLRDSHFPGTGGGYTIMSWSEIE